MEYKRNSFSFDVRTKVITQGELYGKTLLEISNDIGVSRTMLHRIMNGAMPTAEVLAKVCTWLNRKPTTYIK